MPSAEGLTRHIVEEHGFTETHVNMMVEALRMNEYPLSSEGSDPDSRMRFLGRIHSAVHATDTARQGR